MVHNLQDWTNKFGTEAMSDRKRLFWAAALTIVGASLFLYGVIGLTIYFMEL